MFGERPEIVYQLSLLVICTIAVCRGGRPLLDERKIRHGVPIEDIFKRNRTTRDALKNIRISVFYDDSVKELGKPAKKRITDDLVPAAVKYVEKLLQIKRANGPILIRRDCQYYEGIAKTGAKHSYCSEYCSKVSKCGEVIIPNEHLMQCHSCVPARYGRLICGRSGTPNGRGVNSDFILYVSAKSSYRGCPTGVIAYASHCQTEKLLDRPVAGYMNICPEYAKDGQRSREFLLSTIKHELLHSLGFLSNLFAFFRDKKGKPLTPRNKFNLPDTTSVRGNYIWSDKVIKRISRPNWWVASGRINRTVYMMVTPNVKREARKHFKCQSLEGAEMESQAESLSHWEKRLFENEGMTSSYSHRSVISRVTLALLEDTGWYKVNYGMADKLRYGKGLGCDFVKKSCGDWMNKRLAKKQSIAPFCNQVDEVGCTASTNNPGICTLKDLAYVPTYYSNYLKVKGVPSDQTYRYGGYITDLDYCGIYAVPKVWEKEAKRKASKLKCK